jgi:hypothetical protein
LKDLLISRVYPLLATVLLLLAAAAFTPGAAAAAAGGSVWCDSDMYPRKLFVEMKGGRAVWRCACFKELGWSDVRKVSRHPRFLNPKHACSV